MTTIKNIPTVAGTFIERTSRFSARVEINGQECQIYVPNSGRMKELLIPGTGVFLAFKNEPHRKTKYDLLMVEYKGNLVNIDSRLPNEIIYRALQAGELPQFTQFHEVKKEVRYNASRLDFKLLGNGQNCYIEVKSVTLVNDKTARFPDAPTPRGTRHLKELVGAVREGNRGAVIFVIQRDDAEFFTPNNDTDPDFAACLKQVQSRGVEVYAYTCTVSREEIMLQEQVKIIL